MEESTQKEGFCLFLLSNSVAAEAICELYGEEDDLAGDRLVASPGTKDFSPLCGELKEHEKSQLLAKLGSRPSTRRE